MPALDRPIRIRVERCQIPIVWLDTSFLIRLALLDAGRLAPSLVPTYSALQERLSRLVAKNAIVCPRVDQPSEVWVERKMFLDKLVSVSKGVDMKPKLAIDDEQVWKLMSAYLKGQREVVFSYRDAFYHDPVMELMEVSRQRFIVTADMGIFPSVEKAKEERKSLHRAWEEMRKRRVAEGATFEEQKELERRGRFRSIFQLAHGAINTIMQGGWPDDMNEMEGYNYIMTMIDVWKRLDGTPPNLHGVVRFVDSSHYAAHLINDIEATLLARLMTGTEPIQSGDEMDIAQIATVLPFADLMLVDRKMRHYVRDLGLADKYGARVCSVKDWDEINGYLDDV